MLDPEIVRQLHDAGVQQVGVFQHMVVEIVFRRQTERTRLDPHVDVFRHQYHGPAGLLHFQCAHYAEDLVVGFAHRQAFWKTDVVQFSLEIQVALGILVAELG